jgi:CubicO group peptidase (beta-lactamase class C family)
VPNNAATDALVHRLDAAIERALSKSKIVGVVVLVFESGHGMYRRAAGYMDRETKRPMQTDTIFRLASVTKPLVAATALAMSEKGLITLQDPINRFLPEFRPRLADGGTAMITVEQLLSHTAGFGYPSTVEANNPYNRTGISNGLDMPGRGMEENLQRLASVPLFHEPGTAWRYGMSTDVLGAVIAKVHGGSLADAVESYVTGPLGMDETGFAVTDFSRLAVPYADGSPEPIRMPDPYSVRADANGEGTTFSPSRIFDRNSFQSGGAGMVGTADDFMRFLEAIRSGGAPILKPETVEIASCNQIGDLARDEEDAGWRFGFLSAVLAEPRPANTPQTVGSLDWGGAYGHFWWIDPKAKLSVASFSNTAFEGCSGGFRDEIRRAVYG